MEREKNVLELGTLLALIYSTMLSLICSKTCARLRVVVDRSGNEDKMSSASSQY